MKWIDKKIKNQPASLKRHLGTPHHNYENYDKKDELRTVLLQEQGFICCYCMRRIQEASEDKMKIEHFKPFSVYDGKIVGKPDLTLDFTNLLAVCKGNKGASKHLQHCDESKRNTEIFMHPNDKILMQKIRFNSEGIVYVKEENDFDKTLNFDLKETLNLNVQTLKEERKKYGQRLTNYCERNLVVKCLLKVLLIKK
jgi:uncharacterized protein (TIGR02646 family)